MPAYVMMTRLSHSALEEPSGLEALEQTVMERIHTLCPGVEWLTSYAVLGPYDYLDVFTAADNETATKVATVIRTFGHAQTEIWPATEWRRFKQLVRDLPGRTS